MSSGQAVDTAAVLTQAVRAVYSRWFALRVAAEQAGREGAAVADQLLEDTLVLMHSSVVPSQDDYLELMDYAFDQLQTNVEDGSVEQLAELLVRMRSDADRGDFSIARQQIAKGVASGGATLPWNPDSVFRAVLQAQADDGVEVADDASANANEDDAPMDVSPADSTPRVPFAEHAQDHREPIVDDDGFEMVVRKKGSRARH
jgi:hypothetical protein